MNNVKACAKFFLFILLNAATIPPQAILMLVHTGKGAQILPRLWQKCACTIFRIKINLHGTPHTDSQTIYVSNHISYLDIPVIGSLIDASFVAKDDVESWPLFGYLAKLQQTAFISRDKANVTTAKSALDKALDNGKSIIMFPEGTSTNGKKVRPFKSSLFAIALKDNLKEDIYIQPFTLEVKTVDNKEVTTNEIRDIYAWHIDMDMPLAPHLWRFAKNSGAEISVYFHDPIKASRFSDRKTLAKACHDTVSNGLKLKSVT